jgi:hypothetical protein
MVNNKKTGKSVSKIASKEMKSSKKDKSIDASALVQVQPKKETSKPVATKASRKLKSLDTPTKEKKVAGSVLSQTPKKKSKK